jgi:hypothetical protein
LVPALEVLPHLAQA